MAFEYLQPHRSYIIEKREEGVTLAVLVELLAKERQVETTPGTLSRYLSTEGTAKARPARAPNRAEGHVIDAAALLTEVLAEIHGRSDEQRAATEHLAGKVAGMGMRFEELEKTMLSQPQGGQSGELDPALLRQVWGRAFMLVTALWAIVTLTAGVLVWLYIG